MSEDADDWLAVDRDEEYCRVCSEQMGEEGGVVHNDCHEAAKEEFEWYP